MRDGGVATLSENGTYFPSSRLITRVKRYAFPSTRNRAVITSSVNNASLQQNNCGLRDERRLLLCAPGDQPTTDYPAGYKTCKLTRNSTIASVFNVSLC